MSLLRRLEFLTGSSCALLTITGIVYATALARGEAHGVALVGGRVISQQTQTTSYLQTVGIGRGVVILSAVGVCALLVGAMAFVSSRQPSSRPRFVLWVAGAVFAAIVWSQIASLGWVFLPSVVLALCCASLATLVGQRP